MNLCVFWGFFLWPRLKSHLWSLPLYSVSCRSHKLSQLQRVGNRFHFLMGEWQVSGRAYGTRNIVITIFGESNLTHSSIVWHMGYTNTHIYMVCLYNLYYNPSQLIATSNSMLGILSSVYVYHLGGIYANYPFLSPIHPSRFDWLALILNSLPKALASIRRLPLGSFNTVFNDIFYPFALTLYCTHLYSFVFSTKL